MVCDGRWWCVRWCVVACGGIGWSGRVCCDDYVLMCGGVCVVVGGGVWWDNELGVGVCSSV